MRLFERFRLSVTDAEAKLGRRLIGDLLSGERAVLHALNEAQLDEVERQLTLNRSLKPDFRQMIEDQVRKGQARWCEYVRWQVELPMDAYKEYRAQAWEERRNLMPVLSRELELNLKRRQLEAIAREAVRTGDLAALRATLAAMARAEGESSAEQSGEALETAPLAGSSQ
jgi:hypothetical protein